MNAISPMRTRTRSRVPLQPVAKPDAGYSLRAPAIGDNSKATALAVVEDALADYWTKNTTANKAKSDAEKAKKALEVAMTEAEMTTHRMVVEHGDRRTPVVATIAEVQETYISVEKLKGLVSPEQFMAIISATKTSVEAIAGKNVATQAAATRIKPPALAVKEDK